MLSVIRVTFKEKAHKKGYTKILQKPGISGRMLHGFPVFEIKRSIRICIDLEMEKGLNMWYDI